MSDKSLQAELQPPHQQENNAGKKTNPKKTRKKATSQRLGYASKLDREAIPSGQAPLPSKNTTVKAKHPSIKAKQRPIEAKQTPAPSSRGLQIIKGNPIASMLQAIGQFWDGKSDINQLNLRLGLFYQDFGAYMLPNKVASKGLREYLYNLETSIGKLQTRDLTGQGSDPRQNHELELLKDYLGQLAQKYPYPEWMVGHYAAQLLSYIDTYQNRFNDPKKELQLRGHRQVFIGKQSEKVVRVGYDPKATQHQMYLVDEDQDKVIDQHMYAEQNQAMMQSLFVGQKLSSESIFGEVKDWTEKKGIQGVATPKESHIKNYHEVPLGIEIAVSVLTPVGPMNSAYMLTTGKDLMHPEKKKLSNWEKAFAVADLVLILPLGKVVKVPGKIATRLGRSSDEAAELLKTGKKVGDDFVVEVAENSKYAQKFLEAEAKLAAKQAKKTEAVKKADQAYQKYKDLKRAKYARKVAKGLDGALYIKFFPDIHGELAAQGVNLVFVHFKAKALQWAEFLAELKATRTWNQLAKQSENLPADDSLYGLYQALHKIKSDKNLHQQMQQALLKSDKDKAAELIANHSFKVGFGSAVLGFKKIAYSEANDLVQRVINFRRKLGAKAPGKTQHATSGSNVAIFEYIDKSGNIAYKEAMAMGKEANHAEKLIIRELAKDGIPPENVTRIYSELDSCVSCTGELAAGFTKAKGFYSFELNDVGKILWRDAIKDLF